MKMSDIECDPFEAEMESIEVKVKFPNMDPMIRLLRSKVYGTPQTVAQVKKRLTEDITSDQNCVLVITLSNGTIRTMNDHDFLHLYKNDLQGSLIDVIVPERIPGEVGIKQAGTKTADDGWDIFTA